MYLLLNTFYVSYDKRGGNASETKLFPIGHALALPKADFNLSVMILFQSIILKDNT